MVLWGSIILTDLFPFCQYNTARAPRAICRQVFPGCAHFPVFIVILHKMRHAFSTFSLLFWFYLQRNLFARRSFFHIFSPGRHGFSLTDPIHADRRGKKAACRPAFRRAARCMIIHAGAFWCIFMTPRDQSRDLLSTISWSLAEKSDRLMAPRSSPLRVRTETVPFSISRSPTTSI